jgi:hypothetical protein
MSGKHCRLYDENLVHNIMISTGISVVEYMKDHKYANSDDVCEFVEFNARNIIDDTIEQLNSSDDQQEEKKDVINSESDEREAEDDQWPYSDADQDPKA